MSTQDRLKSLPVTTVVSIEGTDNEYYVDLAIPDAMTTTKVTKTYNGFNIFLNVVGNIEDKIDYTWDGMRFRILSDKEVEQLTDLDDVVSESEEIGRETNWFVIGQLSYFAPKENGEGTLDDDWMEGGDEEFDFE